MTDITKRRLNFEKTSSYFIDSIEGCNKLGNRLLEQIQFDLGSFFTFAPSNLSISSLYSFKYSMGGAVYDTIHSFIYNFIQGSTEASCLFDDFNSKYEKDFKDPFFYDFGKFFKEEVYYLLRNSNANLKAIETAYNYSDTIWHSLGILSEAKVNSDPKVELTIQEIEEVCLNAKYIFVTAYDGEGCIFWEKN